MSKPVKSLAVSKLPAFIPATSDPARLEKYLHGFFDLEKKIDRTRVLSQALQGLVLTELKVQHAKHGGDRKSGAIKTQGLGLDWDSYLKKEYGISDGTAENRIKCWTAVKAHIEKLPPAERKSAYKILSKSMTKITDKEWKILQAITHKVTDGKTQAELIAGEKWLIQEHGAALEDATRSKKKTPAATVAHEVLVKDKLWIPIMGGDGSVPTVWKGIDDLHESFHEKVKLGHTTAELWEFADHKQRKDLLAALKKEAAIRAEKLKTMIGRLEEAAQDE